MIKVNFKDGKMVEAHVEGSGAELIAEMACITHSICKHLAEAEQSKKDRALTYAYFMTLVSKSIVSLLDEDADIKEVLKDNKQR